MSLGVNMVQCSTWPVLCLVETTTLIWERQFCENFSAPIHYHHLMYYQLLTTVFQLKEGLNTPSLVPEELEDKHNCDMYCHLVMLTELGSLNRLEHFTVL